MKLLSLVACLIAFKLSNLVAAQGQSAIEVIMSLNTLAEAYQSLTNLTESLTGSGGSDPNAGVVARTYANVTALELANEQGPQSLLPFSEAGQYGIASAAHSLTVEDLAFLLALESHVNAFSLRQLQSIADSATAQTEVVTVYLQDTAIFAPIVLPALTADVAMLTKTLPNIVSLFSG